MALDMIPMNHYESVDDAFRSGYDQWHSFGHFIAHNSDILTGIDTSLWTSSDGAVVPDDISLKMAIFVREALSNVYKYNDFVKERFVEGEVKTFNSVWHFWSYCESIVPFLETSGGFALW